MAWLEHYAEEQGILLLVFPSLIPKPQKDPTKIENFRPISFTNINAKILMEVVTEKSLEPR